MSSNYNSINVAQATNTRVRIEETGTFVNIRDSCHAKTNHYIDQSRDYFPGLKLYTYIECPYFIRLSVLLLIASVFGFMWRDNQGLPLGFSIACAVFFLIYCQHERVNQKTLPIVLLQPVIASQPSSNSFYEVTVTEFKTMALETYQAGIGFVKITHGKIKFQAFNNGAIQRMSSAKCQSRALLLFFFIATVYNLYYTVVAYTTYRSNSN